MSTWDKKNVRCGLYRSIGLMIGCLFVGWTSLSAKTGEWEAETDPRPSFRLTVGSGYSAVLGEIRPEADLVKGTPKSGCEWDLEGEYLFHKTGIGVGLLAKGFRSAYFYSSNYSLTLDESELTTMAIVPTLSISATRQKHLLKAKVGVGYQRMDTSLPAADFVYDGTTAYYVLGYEYKIAKSISLGAQLYEHSAWYTDKNEVKQHAHWLGLDVCLHLYLPSGSL